MIPSNAIHKVHILPVYGGNALRTPAFEGWTELERPEKGWPFRAYGKPLDEAGHLRFLQTSPVVDFHRLNEGDVAGDRWLVETENSTYEVQYLQGEPHVGR